MAQQENPTPRRGFFSRAGGLLTVALASAAPAASQAETAAATQSSWPGKLKGRHRQMVDAFAPKSGYPLAFAYTFLATSPDATAVVVLRHHAFPLALASPIWAKYKIGRALDIIDPETNAPAEKNPYLHPKPGVLVIDQMAIDRLLSKNVIFGACGIALQVFSAKLASLAGVTPEAAAAEWKANLIPGITLLPSGTWGVNRAQEHGCTYCSGG